MAAILDFGGHIRFAQPGSQGSMKSIISTNNCVNVHAFAKCAQIALFYARISWIEKMLVWFQTQIKIADLYKFLYLVYHNL
jgi:hypothetical protein